MSEIFSPTDTPLIGQFQAGELTGPCLEVSIIELLGDPGVPGSFRARAYVLSTEPDLKRSNGSAIPCGSLITVFLKDRLPDSPLLTALDIGLYLGSNAVVTLFEVSLIDDETVAMRGYAIFS